MIDLNKILNESLESTWSPKQYPAYSQAPRKDFVPFSTKDGYNFPNQQNQAVGFPPTVPQPPNPSSVPWPLQTINTDLADAFVLLLAAAGKLSECVKNNTVSLTENQKSELLELFKKLKVSLNDIKDVGMRVTDVVNMAEQPPPQVPVAPIPSKPESQPKL